MKIVALSDQHGYLPEIPPCDVLIVAGDICPDGVGPTLAMLNPDRQKAWFNDTMRPWLASSPASNKVATWGNHDWCGQMCDFSHDAPGVASPATLQILVDEVTHIRAGRSAAGGGEGSSLAIWGTPWSNRFMNWAFMKTAHKLAEKYRAIPEGIDILVSHQPPFGYGDRHAASPAGTSAHLGSRELLNAIDRVKPRLVICGHIHSGRGRYEHNGIPIYNVSVVDEEYRLAYAPTVIDFP